MQPKSVELILIPNTRPKLEFTQIYSTLLNFTRIYSTLHNPIWTTALKAVCAAQNPDNGSSTEVAKSHSERDKKPF